MTCKDLVKWRQFSIDAKGLGKSTPVASNDAFEGRLENRRVELAVSGGAI